MKLIATLKSPLVVVLPRKKKENKRFILNLNHYRNAHYHTLNQAKVKYKEMMQAQIDTLPVMKRVAVRFTPWTPTKQVIDNLNVCSIHDKFFMDALVESGKLEDDNCKIYIETSYRSGGKDKDDPRVDIEIFEV